jgi:hypothetical protein
MDHREPQQHPVPHVNTTRNYVTRCVRALVREGLVVDRSWLDPCDPRDATVILGDARALVWDEMTGWRAGVFHHGEQGVRRTTLGDPVHLGGGPLPPPEELAWRACSGTAAFRRVYRSYADADGFDEALHTYGS